ncbi:MAG: HAD family hydrolase, partial [Mariprofundus sp.]|nr:HAD family hydrolase [Mariprofundus sp.]
DEDYLEKIKPLTGAETLFQWLQDNRIPTAIVTSKSQMRADAQLDALNWTKYFDVVIGKMDGRPEKPDPGPVLLACHQLDLNPEHTVMVGDGIADMKSAVRAGSCAVGLCDAFSAKELTEVGASRCFDSLTEVHTWLKTQIN